MSYLVYILINKQNEVKWKGKGSHNYNSYYGVKIKVNISTLSI